MRDFVVVDEVRLTGEQVERAHKELHKELHTEPPASVFKRGDVVKWEHAPQIFVVMSDKTTAIGYPLMNLGGSYSGKDGYMYFPRDWRLVNIP